MAGRERSPGRRKSSRARQESPRPPAPWHVAQWVWNRLRPGSGPRGEGGSGFCTSVTAAAIIVTSTPTHPQASARRFVTPTGWLEKGVAGGPCGQRHAGGIARDLGRVASETKTAG